MIYWSKKGLLIEKGKEGFTHASHPCAIKIEKDIYLIAFSSRKNQQGHIFITVAEFKNQNIKIVTQNYFSPNKARLF